MTTTGGIGFLGRRHGPRTDHVAAAERVLADGTGGPLGRRRAPGPVIRGAGGNFDAPCLHVRAVGGAVDDVHPLATAYAHRRLKARHDPASVFDHHFPIPPALPAAA